MPDWLRDLLFDTDAIRFVQQTIGLGRPRPFELLSLLGDTWGILLVVGLAYWLFGRQTSYALLGIIALASLTKELMSLAFSLPRPSGEGIVVYEELEVESFPSGHLYQILAPWSLLYALRAVPLLAPVAVAVLVSVARLYLGVHYLGDLVFAALAAVLLAWGFAVVWPRVWPWLRERPVWVYAVLAGLAVAGVVASMVVRFNNPRRWEILGLVAGTALALLLEPRLIDYRPEKDTPWTRQAAKIGIGAGGIVLCLVLDRLLFAAEARVPGLFTCGAAALWALLAAPWLFRRLGWSAEK